MSFRSKIAEFARAFSGRSAPGWWGLTPEVARSLGYGRFGSTPTRAGVSVGPLDSLEVAVYAACIGVVARIMSAIPCNVYKTIGKTDRSEIATDHPLNIVLSRKANKESTAFTWQNQQVVNRIVFGDSYSIMDFNGFSQVNSLWPCISSNVEPIYLENTYQLSEYDDVARPGDLAYRVTKTWPQYYQHTYPKSRILHIPYPFTLNGFLGVAPHSILRARLAIGKALVAWEQDFFGKGFSPAYIGNLKNVSVGGPKRQQLIDDAKEEFEGFKSNHGLLMLAHGIDVKQDAYRLDYAMLSERERGVVEDICGFLGVPPMLVMRFQESTFNNSFESTRHFKTATIFPWTVNDEQSFNCWLLGDAALKKGYFCKYDPKIMDLQDPKAWSDMIRNLWLTGSITPNEIRKDMRKNPLPPGSGGNQTYVQAQMVPLAGAGETETEKPAGQGLEVVNSEAA